MSENQITSPRKNVTRRSFLWALSAIPATGGLITLGGRSLSSLAAATTTATPAGTSTALVQMACITTPSQTEGPYFVDEMLKRVDIRLDPTDNSIRPGTLLKLKVNVFNVNDTMCSPLPDVQVDIWHCDANGDYSDVGNLSGTQFLRGYQTTDANGSVDFITVYPGYYQGRTVHIHMKVRTFSATSQTTYEFTTQLYFDDAISDSVYSADSAYRPAAARNTRNLTDGIFTGAAGTNRDADDYGDQIMVKLTKDAEGYSGLFNIGVDLSNPVTEAGNGGGNGGGGRPPRPRN